MFNRPFWPLLTGAEGTVILTGVTVARGRTLLFAAFGRCLGAIDVSVGPTESVILQRRRLLWFSSARLWTCLGLSCVPPDFLCVACPDVYGTRFFIFRFLFACLENLTELEIC